MIELRDFKITNSISNRKFGFTIAVVCFGVSVYLYFRGNENWKFASIGGGVVLIASLVYPRILTHLNNVWFYFGVLLQRLISPIILFAFYVILIIPVAMIQKLFKKNRIKKSHTEIQSNWIIREKQHDFSQFKHLY